MNSGLATLFGFWRRQHAPFRFSWVLQQELAIGPIPRSAGDWALLERAGIRSRFSCCYLEEEVECCPAPPGLREKRCSLPDHRDQEPLRAEHLREAINEARWLLSNAKPLYLHCLAGQERSALLAVALVKEQRNLSLLDALLWVRRTHPPASPLYRHLELLETLSQESN